MAELSGPFELLELQDGASARFRIQRWEVGETTIKTTEVPSGKRITILRVHVPQADKPNFPFYWDVTARTLQAQLEPHLTRPDIARLTFIVTARGFPPKKRFSLDVIPA